MRWGERKQERKRGRETRRVGSEQEGELTPLSGRLISGSCQPGCRGSPFKAEGLFNVQTSSRKSRAQKSPRLQAPKNRGDDNAERSFWKRPSPLTRSPLRDSTGLYCGERWSPLLSSLRASWRFFVVVVPRDLYRPNRKSLPWKKVPASLIFWRSNFT